MSEEEKGYEVKDKRRIRLDENADAQMQSNDETVSDTASEQEDQQFSIPDVDVYTLLRSFIGLLSMHVWHWMGIMKNPATDQLDKDLAQAKVAIDTIAAMAGQLEGKMNPEEQREIMEMLSNLRINYVQQSAKQD